MYRHYKNGFYVSTKGKVKRVRNGKIKKIDLYTNKYGYKYFILFNTVDKEKVYVHRAVAELFIPQNDKSKYIVNHIDRDRGNNCVSTLRWVDKRENLKNSSRWE